MRSKARIIFSSIAIVILLLSTGGASAERSAAPAQLAPVSPGFTYQGLLKNASGQPVTGVCDFQFTLWDALDTGVQIGITNTVLSVGITQGYFTAQVNAGGEFGPSAFAGEARWLAIAVRCPAGGTGAYTPLAPRQALTAAPYALYAAQANTALSAAEATTATYALAAPWTGLTGIPAGFADGADNDTLYTAGAGLSLAGNQFSVVTSTVQQRVNEACAVDSTIRVINADGSVVCQADATEALSSRAGAPSANLSTTVSTGGYDTALTIGTDGLPVVTHYDQTNFDLKVLHCGDRTCSSGNITTTVDSSGIVGSHAAIVIGADGLAVISYYDQSNTDLKVLHCGNTACSSGNTLTTVDSSGNVGYYTSIAIGSDGLPVVSYYDQTNADLKVLHCGNAACSSGNTLTTLDSAGDVGGDTSIALGADGLPVISYQDRANWVLKVLHCGSAACSSGNISTTVDSAGSVGMFSSLAIGSDGLPVVSYYDQSNTNLKVLHCGDTLCAGNNLSTTVDSNGSVGQHTALTIGADGLPVISYNDYTNATAGLKVLHCGNTACSSGNTATLVDSAATYGYETFLTLGADGLPAVSYYAPDNASLKVLHCANVFCVPYFRRR